MSPQAAFEALNRAAGIAPLGVPKFDGEDGAFAPFRFGAAASAALGFAGAVAGEVWRFRGGDRQSVAVDQSVAARSLEPDTIVRRNGSLIAPPPDDAVTTGFYQTGDKRWLYLKGGAPHLARRLRELLNAKDERSAMVSAVAKWNGDALEDALAFLGLPGALVRSAQEWAGLHTKLPSPITLTKIAEAPPFRPEENANPLGALRVLDLTHLIGGAAAGATLAMHGAEVLQIVPPSAVGRTDYAFAQGKRVGALDLTKPGDAEVLRQLLRETHIFLDSYRPGALAGLGFSPQSLAHIAPGIVSVSLSAYHGSWAPRRGFEEVVEAATGLAVEFGAARKSRFQGQPGVIGAPVLSILTGYLAAAGAMAALLKRIREGGSWHVEVSLAASAAWVLTLGRIPLMPEAKAPQAGLDPYLYSCETKGGWFELLGPVVRMDKTPLIKGALPDGLVPPSWPGISAYEKAHAAKEQSAQT